MMQRQIRVISRPHANQPIVPAASHELWGSRPSQNRFFNDFGVRTFSLPKTTNRLDMEYSEINEIHPWFVSLCSENSHQIVGRCLDFSVYAIRRLEREFLFSHHSYELPRISIGNIKINNELCFDEGSAYRFASRLTRREGREKVAEYHAWLNWNGVIVDLTVLYSLRYAGLPVVDEPFPIISTKSSWGACDFHLEWVEYRCYTLAQLMAPVI